MAVKFLSNIDVDGNIETAGKVGGSDTYVICNNGTNVIDFYTNGAWVARLQADGELHVKGDVVAFSDIF